MITIIIPVFNNLAYTQQCIKSIYQYTDKKIFNLLLIDNNSTDGSTEYFQYLEKNEANFSFIRNEQNLGFAKANNQGVCCSESEKVLFLNNDTIVTKNWLNILDRELTENPGVKIAGSKLLYEDNTIQHAGIVFSGFKADNKNIIYHLYRFFPEEHPAVNKKRLFQVLTGACLLMERDFFLKIGGFNENYKNGFEDLDLCLKAGQHDGKCLFCPESTVYHFEAKSKGRFDNTEQNTDLFYSTWGEFIVPDDNQFYEEDGFVLKMVSKEWKVFDTQVQGDLVKTRKQEILDIVFEKRNKNIDFILFLKAENTNLKDCLLKLQINTLENFKLFIIANPKSETLPDKFKNLNLIPETAYNLETLKNIIEETEIKKIIFLNSSENITFRWDEKYVSFTKEFLLAKIQQFNNEIVEKNDLEILKNLNKLSFNEVNLNILLAEAFQINGKFHESLEITSKILKTKPKNQKNLKIMINSLIGLGDNITAEKLKKLL